MRIETALYASKEGLQAHGSALSVVGDNISNANTVGYKASRPEFVDILADAESGSGSRGVLSTTGNGSQIARVRQVHVTGVVEFTARPLDAAITGEGFFIVGDSTNQRYTRVGTFALDDEGYLAAPNGDRVLGFSDASSTTLEQINLLNFDPSGSETSSVEIFGNLSSTEDTVDSVPNNPATFREIADAANFVSSFSVFDSLGEEHTITLAFFKTATNTWTAQAYINGADVGGTEDVPVQVGSNATLSFGTDGKIADADQAQAIITAQPNYSNGAAAGNFTIDLSSFTQFASGTAVSGLNQDGVAAGEVTSYEIASDGTINAVLSNGTREAIGIIALATFSNPEGLDRRSNGQFVQTELSGSPDVGLPGTQARGEIQGGAVERSTVDIANEFI
ncbi:MAG: flagellar hook protein FlgE, partial [Candidatus Dadabacteria bacterium]